MESALTGKRNPCLALVRPFSPSFIRLVVTELDFSSQRSFLFFLCMFRVLMYLGFLAPFFSFLFSFYFLISFIYIWVCWLYTLLPCHGFCRVQGQLKKTKNCLLLFYIIWLQTPLSALYVQGTEGMEIPRYHRLEYSNTDGKWARWRVTTPRVGSWATGWGGLLYLGQLD